MCSRDAYRRLLYFAHLLATDTEAHTHSRKTVLQTFSCPFVQDQDHFKWSWFYIVLHIDRKLIVVCKQNDEIMQCIKHGVSIGHVCLKNTHYECEGTQVKHTYILRNKIQLATDVNGYGYHIRICICIRALAKPLYFIPVTFIHL